MYHTWTYQSKSLVKMSPCRFRESWMLFSDAGLDHVVLHGGLVNQQIRNVPLGGAEFVQSSVRSSVTGVNDLVIWNKVDWMSIIVLSFSKKTVFSWKNHLNFWSNILIRFKWSSNKSWETNDYHHVNVIVIFCQWIWRKHVGKLKMF